MNATQWDHLAADWRRLAGLAAVGFAGATATITPDTGGQRNSRVNSSRIPRPTEVAVVTVATQVTNARNHLLTAAQTLDTLAEATGTRLLPHPNPITATRACAWIHEAATDLAKAISAGAATGALADDLAYLAGNTYRHGLEDMRRCTRLLAIWTPRHRTQQEVRTCACPPSCCTRCPDQLLVTDRKVSDRCRSRIARAKRKATA